MVSEPPWIIPPPPSRVVIGIQRRGGLIECNGWNAEFVGDSVNNIGRESESTRISEALASIMELAIAEPFNYPVDLTSYPGK